MPDNTDILSRLAVIESRLQDILGHLMDLRRYVPDRVVEHSERLEQLERAMRSVVWGVALAAGGLLSAFLAHVFGKG
ncbi:MAG: hypothetical protein ACUVSM_05280 [Armatimonadota bacterium]|jgi:hypothetical protein